MCSREDVGDLYDVTEARLSDGPGHFGQGRHWSRFRSWVVLVSCAGVYWPAMARTMPAAPTVCQPPSPTQAWVSATREGALLSPRLDEANWRIKRNESAGKAGHWIHLSASGPVHGALAWWPCGASTAHWIPTGSFVSWKKGPQLPRQRAGSVWLETEQFGTGLQVRRIHWAMASDPAPTVVWQGDVDERFSGPDFVEVRRQLLSVQADRWRVVERRLVNGQRVRVRDQLLCLAPRPAAGPGQAAVLLRPCPRRY